MRRPLSCDFRLRYFFSFKKISRKTQTKIIDWRGRIGKQISSNSPDFSFHLALLDSRFVFEISFEVGRNGNPKLDWRLNSLGLIIEEWTCLANFSRFLKMPVWVNFWPIVSEFGQELKLASRCQKLFQEGAVDNYEEFYIFTEKKMPNM